MTLNIAATEKKMGDIALYQSDGCTEKINVEQYPYER